MTINKANASATEHHMSGTAVVCCIHQVPKREKVELYASDRPGGEGQDFAHICICCENMFLLKTPVPHYCSKCTGKPVPPEWDLPEGKAV